MSVDEQLQKALRSPNPGQALRGVVVALFREGRRREQIYECLEHFLVRLRTQSDYRESDEDALLDTLDALTGWCHPEVRLSSPEEPAVGKAPPTA